MNISDISVGSSITVEVSCSGSKLELETTVTKQLKKVSAISVKQVMCDGCRVKLSSDKVKVSVVLRVKGDKPIIWKHCSVEEVKSASEVVMVIRQSSDGVEYNRRQAYRQFVGIPGIAQIKEHSKTYNVTVKNISENGFAFVVREEIADCIGRNVRLQFTDNSCIRSESNVVISGTVCRLSTTEDGKFVYGCESKYSKDIVKYISNKQALEASKRTPRVSRYC